VKARSGLRDSDRPSSAGGLGDLLLLDLAANDAGGGVGAALAGPAWGAVPPARAFHGAASDGRTIYAHGGVADGDGSSETRAGGGRLKGR
jgi:hypothetical protein